MTTYRGAAIAQLRHPADAGPAVRRELISCWVTVTNAGGAAGFPFPPVSTADIAPAVDALIARLSPRECRVLLARVDGHVAGWVALSRSLNPLVAHWGTVNHLQTLPGYRGQGIGSALMRRLREAARDELGLEQLHLEARGGMGLEDFYIRLGWTVIGRWPGKLRLSPTDTRDEILMILAPL